MSEEERTFVGAESARDRRRRLMSDPARAARVSKIREATAEMDRIYAMNLAMVREAAELTQVEVAKRLGSAQGVVSRTENRRDMYLSTLYNYLTATGATDVAITLTINGKAVALDLEAILGHPALPESETSDEDVERPAIAAAGEPAAQTTTAARR
ncbi:XRE family transcriptional regulator [Catenulispora yoronensis]